LISRWEDHFRHRGEDMINSKHMGMAEIGGPNINSITREGENTSADVEIPHQKKIQKVAL
jgi:hypothetical protein